ILDPKELANLAELNLRASRKAIEAAAAEPALRYAKAGLALLSEQDWERRYELTRDLHSSAVESAFTCADLEMVQTLSATFLRHARTPLDEARVRRIEAQVALAQMRVDEAIDVLTDLLSRIGFPLPSPPTPEAIAEEMRRTEAALSAHAIEDLVRLPRCADAA